MKQQTNTSSFKYSISILALLYLLVTILAFLWLHDFTIKQTNLLKVESALQNYEINKLNFCIDNQIKPCSKEEIINWNTDHGDQQFQPVNKDDVINNLKLDKTVLF